MANCINKNLKEFKDLQKELEMNPHILAAKIAIWQEDNNSESFPTASEILLEKELASELKVFRNDKTKEIEKVLAPNGKESELFKSINNLPEVSDKEDALQLYAKTYTKSFKNWFGKGLVDSNNEPILLFHGTNKEFETFIPDNGIYLTESLKDAEEIYGQAMPLFLNASNLEKKELSEIDEDRENLDKSKDKEYYALNKRNKDRVITEYVVFDSNKVKSLFNEGEYSKTNDVIYYNKTKEFALDAKSYKDDMAKRMSWDVMTNRGWISKDKHNGKHTIMHTYKDSSYSGKRTVNQRKQAVTDHHRMLEKLNERESNGEKPFIIKELAPTKDGVPNYTVEINEDYLNIEWEKLKVINESLDNEVDNDEHGRFPVQQKLNLWEDLQLETGLEEEFDTLEDVQNKIAILQESLGDFSVVSNSDLPPNVYGRVVKNKDGVPIIEINPSYVRKDTVIHEFGHLFIDMLGGMSNNFIKRGRKLLEGSEIEKSVTDIYGTGDEAISGELLDKEILTTAVGKEGAKLYDLQKESPFQAWVKIFLNKVRLTLHLKGSVALELANRMLNNKVNRADFTGEFESAIQYSKSMGSEINTSKEDLELSRLSNRVLERITILKSKYDKAKGDTEKVAKFKEEIAKLAKLLEYQKDIKGLVRYVDEITKQSKSINSRIDKINSIMESEDKLDVSDSIKQLGTYIGVFDLIPEIRDYYTSLLRDKNKLDPKTKKLLEELEIDEKLSEAEAKLTKINSEYSTLRRNHMLNIMTPKSKRMNFFYKIKYQKEFYASNGGYSRAKAKYGKRLAIEKERFISDKLAENAEEIAIAERNYIDKILSEAPKDIEFGILGAFAADPRSMDDSLIQYAVRMLDEADYRSMTRFINERNKALELHKELYNYMGQPSKQEVLYEGIYEKVNGKKTNHLVGKYLSSFKEAERKWYVEFEEKYGRVPNKSEKKSFYATEKSKYLNPQWDAIMALPKTNPKRKVYDYLIDSFEKKELLTPTGYSLDTRVDAKNKTFRLPTIEKGTIEALYSNGLGTSIGQKVRQTFTKNPNDLEFQEDISDKELNFKKTLVNESGKENHTIPIYYRGKHKDESKQSFDLVGINLMDQSQLYNYEEKSKIGTSLELIAEQAGARYVTKRSNGKTVINAIMGNEQSTVAPKGINSQVYRALNSIIEDRLYGISTIDAGDIKILGKKININKAADGVLAWTGHTMLMLNHLSTGVNIMQGKYQNFLEGAGGDIYNRSNLRNGEKLWMADSVKSMADIGREIPTSKTNLLIEKFNAFADFSGLNYSLVEDNFIKKKLDTSMGHFLNHSAEYYIQGTLMYSVLDSIKVTVDGKSIPMHEAYELKDGKLQSKINLSKEELIDLETTVSIKIQDIIKNVHGNYNKDNQAMAQRYVAGKFAFLMRKWLVPGVQRRFRGGQYISKGLNRTEDDILYSDILEKDMEGYYVTSLRFLGSLRKELASAQFSIVSSEWNHLTDTERANIKKTVVDLSAIILSLLAANLLAGLAEDADDEDKKMYYTMAYLFRRQYSELRFYTSGDEFLKILATPSASLSMLQRGSDVIGQLTNPFEEYETGESKLLRKIRKATPIYGQIDRDVQALYNYMARE